MCVCECGGRDRAGGIIRRELTICVSQVLRLKGIPSLLTLLRSPNAQVQQTVSAALRNLVFKNNSNKQEVQHCGGIAEALNLLKDTDSAETQKQLTGRVSVDE